MRTTNLQNILKHINIKQINQIEKSMTTAPGGSKNKRCQKLRMEKIAESLLSKAGTTTYWAPIAIDFSSCFYFCQKITRMIRIENMCLWVC